MPHAISVSLVFIGGVDAGNTGNPSPFLFSALQKGLLYERTLPPGGTGRDQRPVEAQKPSGAVDAFDGIPLFGTRVRPALPGG